MLRVKLQIFKDLRHLINISLGNSYFQTFQSLCIKTENQKHQAGSSSFSLQVLITCFDLNSLVAPAPLLDKLNSPPLCPNASPDSCPALPYSFFKETPTLLIQQTSTTDFSSLSP